MPRQDPFARLRKDPQDTLSSIPQARERKRGREWEKANPSASYFIPGELHERAKDVRAAILGLAHRHMTTTSSVASALMSYSLAMVRKGKMTVEARPDVNRRKMALTWEEVEDGWRQEIPPPRKQPIGKSELYLNYRWSGDIDRQVRALAGGVISTGEVVVFLLSYALDAHREGRLRLKEEAVVMTQKVSSRW
jgi:hypothetical protein